VRYEKLKDIGFNLIALVGTINIPSISLFGIARGFGLYWRARCNSSTGAPQDAGEVILNLCQ
jgi:hypothetical protein